MESVKYNSHYNWEWVVQSAVASLECSSGSGCSSSIGGCNDNVVSGSVLRPQTKTRDLPSRKVALKIALDDYNALRSPGIPPNLPPLPPPPSIKNVSDGAFSLFRCEIVDSSNELVSAIWASNKDLEFLDAKDMLQRCVVDHGAADVMPYTVLIPWNMDNEEDLYKLLSKAAAEVASSGSGGSGCGNDSNDNTVDDEKEMNYNKFFESDGSSYFLKAALGSGGFGIYSNIRGLNDILEVIRGHSKRAQSYEGFLDNLVKTYGEIPSWSLQKRIMPVTASIHGASRNTQIRSYSVFVDNKMYLYNDFEVRVPIWEVIDSSAAVVSDVMSEAEVSYLGTSSARPYNQGRNKKETERYLLDELPELVGSAAAIREASQRLLQSFKKSIFQRRGLSTADGVTDNVFCTGCGMNRKISNLSECALLGIDLVVERTESGIFKAYVVEVNNNPAIAPENKKMTSKYKDHLLLLVERVIKLGLGSKSGRYKEASDHFLLVWDGN